MYTRSLSRKLVPSISSGARSFAPAFKSGINAFNLKLQIKAPVQFHVSRHYSSDVETLKNETNHFEFDNSAETTGVLDCEKDSEIVLYFDHIYPLPVSKLFYGLHKVISPIQKKYTVEELKDKVKEVINTENNILPSAVTIKDFVPLSRDGGAFVKFLIPQDSTPKEIINQILSNLKDNEIEQNENIIHYLKNLFWNNYPAAYQVKGTPWIEDLSRFPSEKLKIKFSGESLSEEELYLLFRRYGKIVDIIPQSSTNPLATIIFKKIRSAISAKNCITGLTLNKGQTTLHLQYIPIKRVNYITDFIAGHQKIAVPAILAIIATVAVLIFDPIREWFIEQKITHKYSLKSLKENEYVKIIYNPYKVILSWMYASYDYIDERINSPDDENNSNVDDNPEKLDVLWNERFERIKQLKLWIYENINTFIIVKGPKGSGKLEFVLEHTLQNDEALRKKVLYIDCDNLTKSRTDNSLIQNTANQLGYFPVFTWTNSFSQFVDLGVQGLTGQKSGLSESKETQIKNMFLLATQSLRNVALSDYQSYRSDAIKKQRHNNQKQQHNTANECAENSAMQTNNEVIKEEDYLQQHPEKKPIIVIDKFMRKSDNNNDFVYKMISEWTSQLIQSNIAHVIYITHDVGSIQHLTDALPNQVFKTISLSDATNKSAKQFVVNQLDNSAIKEKESEIETCLKPLGGRMLDLQAFVRRIKSGESAEDALNEMINQSAEQVTTFFLNNNSLVENNWNTAQIWAIMRLLSTKDLIDFEELNKSPLFKSSKETLATLSTLEKNDLITLNREKGVLSTITTGRPLYKAAFQNLVNDNKVFKLYETDYYENLISLENGKILKLENEIEKISKLNDLNLLKERVKYVGDKIKGCTERIIGYEENIVSIGKMGKDDRRSFLGIKY